MCTYRNAWLALLRCELPPDAYRRVLVRMHDAIIPSMPNPLLLADFLSASVDQGRRSTTRNCSEFESVQRHHPGRAQPAAAGRLPDGRRHSSTKVDSL